MLSFLFVAASASAEDKPAGFDTATGIKNTVTVTGTAGGVDITDLGYEVVAVEAPTYSVTLAKEVTNTGSGTNGKFKEGDTIEYKFTVQNNGTGYLYDVTIADDFADATGSVSGWAVDTTNSTLTTTGTLGTSTDATASDSVYDRLYPGDTVIFTASYTVTADDMSGQGDADNNETTKENTLVNIASVTTKKYDATATDNRVAGPSVTDVTATAALDYVATISIVKSAVLTETNGDLTDDAAAAGDTITYTYTVTNTGTVNLTDVSVTDDHGGLGTFDTTPGFKQWTTQNGSTNADANADVIEILRPGAVAVFETTYTVVQDDIDQLQ